MKTSDKTVLENWHQRTSLTFKMVTITVILGVTLWALLDYIQSNELKKIFYVQIFEKLTEQSMEDRLYVDRYITMHHKTAELIVNQRKFSDYIKKQQWKAEDKVQIKYIHKTPAWYMRNSTLRILARPRYAILLDPQKRVREVFFKKQYMPPSPELLKPTTLMLLKSSEQSFITSIDKSPHLITSEFLLNTKEELQAILMFISPIDEEFLNISKGPFIPSRLVALVSVEKEPTIIVSSNQEKLPKGTSIHVTKNRFIVTGQHTYDYGAAEYILKLVSFISMSEVDKLTDSVISTGRKQRNLIAPAFVITFAIIMFFITRRINRLNNRMSDFSERTLGTQKQEQEKGDQLYILEKRFQRLTEEVIEAREMLTKQAEEKTRLIVKNVFDAIITMDANGVIMTWNPQAEVTFGWKSEEIVGQKIIDTIIPRDYREAHKKGIQIFLKTGTSKVLNKQIEMTALHRDGHEFPVELAVSPARTGNNQFFIAIIRDISERREAENKIKFSLQEKEVLLKEVHHRVKNNMQVISSLLNLQSGYIKNDEYKTMFNESRNRIKSMALVHEKLYRSDDLTKIDIADYIRSIANSLYNFYGASRGRISLKISVNEIALDINTAIPCGLIINELLSNSLKHAFPKEQAGEIVIKFEQLTPDNGPGEYELIVGDNGVGIPDGLDIMNVSSLGMQLIVNLANHQLNGNLELKKTHGTEFLVRFKELNYKKRV